MYDEGMDDVLKSVVDRMRPPDGCRESPIKAFVFDSWFDQYKGCYALVLIKDGILKAGDEICSLTTGKKFQVQQVGLINKCFKFLKSEICWFQVGVLRPDPTPASALYAGQVGFFSANLRNVSDVLIGDTFCSFSHKHLVTPVPGFKRVKPVVFAGLYPVDVADYEDLRVIGFLHLRSL